MTKCVCLLLALIPGSMLALTPEGSLTGLLWLADLAAMLVLLVSTPHRPSRFKVSAKAAMAFAAFIVAVHGTAFPIDLSRSIILDMPKQEMEWRFGQIPGSELTPEDSIAIGSYRFYADTFRVLVIPVEWTYRHHTYSKEVLDSLFFSRDVFPGWSVADYYHEVSYGQLNVVGEVTDWHNLGTVAYINHDSLLEALDPVTDYSEFDGNHDGDADAVAFLFAGNGREDDPTAGMASYAWIYPPGSGPGPFDGVYISRMVFLAETRPLHDPLYPPGFTGADTLNKIRVPCHELGHCMGLPDLYDYDAKHTFSTYYTPNDSNDHPLVDWCLMGYYGYGELSVGSEIPSHFCGWSKMQLGWIEPVFLTGGIHWDVKIYNIETTKDSSLYMLPIDPAEGEYFLLEYRNPNSNGRFDKLDSDFSTYFWPYLSFGGDPLDRGLLITHVHDSLGAYWFGLNDGTPTYPHYTVVVEDAGYNPDMDYTINPGGQVSDSAHWWYPYETRKSAPFSVYPLAQCYFDSTSNPSSDGYSGPSGVIVVVYSIVGDKLYAHIRNPIFSGDADGDDLVGLTDVVYLINWVFRGGPQPIPVLAGEVNCIGGVDIADVVYLINYLFKSGPPPCGWQS